MLHGGQFVRVKTDPALWPRAGKDAMVHSMTGESTVALVFGYDRYNENQGVQACVGPEDWSLDELDRTTIC
jgi:hypothetical protein